MLQAAIEKITSQQPKERTPVWMVGEQLKDILRHEPHLAEIVVQDLEREVMSITNCEKEIKVTLPNKVKIFDLLENVNIGTYEHELIFTKFKPHDAKVLICDKCN